MVNYQGVKNFTLVARMHNKSSISYKIKEQNTLQYDWSFAYSYWLLGAEFGNQGQPMMHLQCSEVFTTQPWVKYLKIWLNHQISYYHPLFYWLLGTTTGNQGQPMMNLQCSEAFPLQKWGKHFKIWLNPQIPYYHPLTYWLLRATIGNQDQPMMDVQCSKAFPLQQWVKYIKICLKHSISYFDWWPYWIIQDGCQCLQFETYTNKKSHVKLITIGSNGL